MPESTAPSPDRVARDVLDSLIEGCQVISPEWKYLYVNGVVAAQAKSTREALLGRTMMECFPGIDATPMFSALKRCMAERKHHRLENEFDFPDGSKGWFELRFIPVPEGVCILSLDVTDVKRAAAALAKSEAQLRQAQKMEAIGRLAGGIAHDFNNLLSVIITFSQMRLQDLPPEDPSREDLEEIKKAGERAAGLTRQLLAFSRQQVIELKPIDLNAVVSNMDKMLRRMIGEDVELRTQAAPELGSVKADASQMEQVLMNLVVNARDAMPTGGRLTLETANVVLDEAYAKEHAGTTPGAHVMLAVSDTGAGMDKATQARLFEPFFTTKEKGKGTGLGLATVFGIVKQHGGSIWVYSELGKGSTFKVYLPRTDEEGRPVAAPAAKPVEGNETILLVEDELPVRLVAQRILTRGGYVVLAAKDAEDAVRICREHQGTIHLLLSDVVMPGTSGPKLAERLKEVRSAMRILFMSGYTDDAVVRHGALVQGAAFVQKPLTPEMLTAKVREVLAAPGG